MTNSFFEFDQFMPHGMCYLWQSDILWTSVISDVLTALAYFSITAAVIVFVVKRKDLPYPSFFILVGSVIFLACGISHLISAVVIWTPIYGISAIAKAITAISSIAAGVLIWRLLPFFLSLPSPTILENTVKQRTTELAKSNASLNEEIAQHKRASEQLLQLKNYKRNIIDSMPSILIGVNLEGKITQWNRAAEHSTGLSTESTVGMSLTQAFPRLSIEQDKIDRAIETGQQQSELRRPFPDNGSTHYEDLTIYPLIANGVEGIVIRLDDVTEHVNMEEQVRRTQKMDALGKLTGGIAHDYNNMLGIIIGYSEFLISKTKDRADLQESLTNIYDAGRRGVKLTNKLLSFSRSSKSEDSGQDLNSLILDQRDMLQKVLTVRVDIKLSLADNLWPIWINKSELIDSIINMCINAMHSMSDDESNACLTLQTSNQTFNAVDSAALGLEKPGEYVNLNIIDTGTGMSATIREKVFDPFFSTKGDGGTGLGLYQVFGFVKRSGGTIKVYSELGQGSKFSLYFPRYQGESDLPPEEAIDGNATLKGHETILVVDDEPKLCKLTSEILSAQGYSVISAESGAQALKLLKENRIDLLLSDVIMPDMDGYQLAAAAQDKYPDLKIQLASGFTDDRHLSAADDSISKDILSKPYSSKELLMRVRSLLDYQL